MQDYQYEAVMQRASFETGHVMKSVQDGRWCMCTENWMKNDVMGSFVRNSDQVVALAVYVVYCDILVKSITTPRDWKMKFVSG